MNHLEFKLENIENKAESKIEEKVEEFKRHFGKLHPFLFFNGRPILVMGPDLGKLTWQFGCLLVSLIVFLIVSRYYIKNGHI
jgi:hypothetical protein